MSGAHAYVAFWSAGAALGGVAGLIVLRARRAEWYYGGAALVLAWVGIVVGSKWQFRLESLPLPDAFLFPPGELASGGRRLDLGLLVGFTLGLVWCLLTRTPVRPVGDALAVAASVLIPVGRLGCLAFGCCMGVVCGPALARFCPRYPPGSEAHLQQLRAGLISLDAPASLPAHPLPLYFGAASLLTLGVLVWMLRRGAPSGSLLLAFLVLRPSAKLALEPLRANPSPSPLMSDIPLAMLACALVAIVGVTLRRITRVRARRAMAAGLLVVALAGHTTPAKAAEPPPLPQEWLTALQDYAKDPVHNRRALRRFRHEPGALLPPVLLLAMADARLRGGNTRAAARLFDEVLSRDPGEPWAGWADLGLGWVALSEGDPSRARARFEHAADGGAPSSAVASLAVALIDLDDERDEAALERFEGLAADARVPPAVRQAAAIGAAHVWLRAGGYREAADAFDRAAGMIPGGRLWDDARFGAAVARRDAGEREEGLAALRALGRMPSPGTPTDRLARTRLDPRRGALLRAGLERYRRLPFRVPEEQIVSLLDRDGPALARAELRLLGEVVEAPRRPRRLVRRRDPLRNGPRSTSRPLDGVAEPTRVVWLVPVVALLVALAIWLGWRRSSGKAGRGAER
jgi:tetratricopeptide (TPR) repeat protein